MQLYDVESYKSFNEVKCTLNLNCSILINRRTITMNRLNNIKPNNIKLIALLIIAFLLFCWASTSEYESDKQNAEDLDEFVYEQIYLNYQCE